MKALPSRERERAVAPLQANRGDRTLADWRRLLTVLALIVALVLLGGCGRKRTPRRIPVRPAPARTVHLGESETGIASWYGNPYHGRQTANGEVYDMEQMTAAHRSMPFETWVRVENLTNHKTVDVRINDRGPYIEGRIIDLSRAAARQIDLIGPGITKVKIVVIQVPPASAGSSKSRSRK